LAPLELGREMLSMDALEFWGQISLLKGGIRWKGVQIPRRDVRMARKWRFLMRSVGMLNTCHGYRTIGAPRRNLGVLTGAGWLGELLRGQRNAGLRVLQQ
jgi:hypothetical protein